MSYPEAYPSPPPSPNQKDPILLNALRYSISEKEYQTLHQCLISRMPSPLRNRAPQPPRYTEAFRTSNDYNAAAVRASVRVFVSAQAGLKIWELITGYVARRRRSQKSNPQTPLSKYHNLRLSLSLSLILLLHRLLFRFFTRLRKNLLTKQAAPFRRRNPRISRSLTSRLAPAIGASLAGFSLGIYPADQLRVSIAIYFATRAAEFAYNALENEGWFSSKPWWWGSWMMMPLATGQLLHSFIFDRDCFPKAYGDFILDHTPQYVQRRPPSYPQMLDWPDKTTIVDSLAEMSRLDWPPFISPILFPSLPNPLPSSLNAISPITSSAHPSLSSLSCALLHPSSPSCLRTTLNHHLASFPPLLKFFALIFGLFSLPRYKAFFARPWTELSALAARVLRMTTFITAAIGSSWGSICLFQHLFPGKFLPTSRWFLGGFLGGMWAFIERKGGRSNFLYSVRLSVDSLWKVGIKRNWWKGVRNGDVWVFVMGLALIGAVYEADPEAVQGSSLRKALGFLRGEGWVDRAGITEHEKDQSKRDH